MILLRFKAGNGSSHILNYQKKHNKNILTNGIVYLIILPFLSFFK